MSSAFSCLTTSTNPIKPVTLSGASRSALASWALRCSSYIEHLRIIASMEATTQPRPQRAALALFDGRGYVGSRNRVESARRHGSQTVRLRVSEGSLSPRPTQSAQASASSGLIEPACGTSRSNPTSAGTQRLRALNNEG